MPKVSVNILTKNRAEFLKRALFSVQKQSFSDYEVIVINDGSTDETEKILNDFQIERLKDLKIITHQESVGITKSRQEALEKSQGGYVTILDDDDEWVDIEKLARQVKYLDEHQDVVLVGGGIEAIQNSKFKIQRFRPQEDKNIRRTMLFRNNFFTSTVMFRREAALKAGGFVKDQTDFCEDYDLWLRMGLIGKMYNFLEVFTLYRLPNYNKSKQKEFFRKQLRLVLRYKSHYPGYLIASIFLKLRIRI